MSNPLFPDWLIGDESDWLTAPDPTPNLLIDDSLLFSPFIGNYRRGLYPFGLNPGGAIAVPPINPGYREGLFSGGPLCGSAIASIFCGPLNTGGVAIYLYKITGNADSPCHSPANPHVSKVIEPVELFRGVGMPQSNPESSLGQESFGLISESTRSFLIFAGSLPLVTWAYFQQNGETMSGQVIKRSQIAGGAMLITIDTAKRVPFSAVF
jgi:hypothetical protein